MGWLDAEVVYFGDEPGVWAVDAASGARRRIADGFPIASAANGQALAVADGLPDSARVRIHTARGATRLPDPPAGFAYAADAFFSPDARRLAIAANSPDGTERMIGVYDRRSGQTRWIRLPAPPAALSAPPQWLDDTHLRLTSEDRRAGTTTQQIVDVK